MTVHTSSTLVYRFRPPSSLCSVIQSSSNTHNKQKKPDFDQYLLTRYHHRQQPYRFVLHCCNDNPRRPWPTHLPLRTRSPSSSPGSISSAEWRGDAPAREISASSGSERAGPGRTRSSSPAATVAANWPSRPGPARRRPAACRRCWWCSTSWPSWCSWPGGGEDAFSNECGTTAWAIERLHTN